MSSRRYVIYDEETSGLNYDYDQILEAAAVTLDEDFNLISGSERTFTMRPRVDVPPHPEASLVHGMSLRRLRETGMTEYQFTDEMLRYLSVPNTFIGGYNNLSFDDEFLRRALFRNLRDPYGHEWRDGNARFDVLNIVRTLYAWEPDSLNWPVNEEGKVSMKLGAIAEANRIKLDNAHDALSDVLATAELLRLVNSLGLYWPGRCMDLTNKREADRLLGKRTALFHMSPFYSVDRCYSSMILPVVRDSLSQNRVICVDLAADPTDMLSMTPEEIRRYKFTPRNELEGVIPDVPAMTVQINKQPSLAEVSEVSPSLHKRMGVDLHQCLEHAKMIASTPGIAQKLQEAFQSTMPPAKDVYASIYSGAFFNPADSRRRDNAHLPGPGNQPAIATTDAQVLTKGAKDERLYDLVVRAQGLHFAGALTNPKAHDDFLDYLNTRLFGDPQSGEALGLTLAEAREAVSMCRLNRVLTTDQVAILDDLEEHYDWMELEAARLQVRELPLAPKPEPEKALETVSARRSRGGFPSSIVRPRKANSEPDNPQMGF